MLFRGSAGLGDDCTGRLAQHKITVVPDDKQRKDQRPAIEHESGYTFA